LEALFMRNTSLAFRQIGAWLSVGFFLGAFALVSAPAVRAQQDQTSLGDIARKLREEKKNEPAGKTFNNENLPTTDKGISVVGQPAPSTEKPAETPAENANPSATPSSPAATSASLLSVQHQMDEALKEKDDLLKQIDLAQRNYGLQREQLMQDPHFKDNGDGQATLNELQQGIDDLKDSLTKVNDHITELQQKLDSLHNQANPGSGSGTGTGSSGGSSSGTGSGNVNGSGNSSGSGSGASSGSANSSSAASN
jgi:hypothetical protein